MRREIKNIKVLSPLIECEWIDSKELMEALDYKTTTHSEEFINRWRRKLWWVDGEDLTLYRGKQVQEGVKRLKRMHCYMVAVNAAEQLMEALKKTPDFITMVIEGLKRAPYDETLGMSPGDIKPVEPDGQLKIENSESLIHSPEYEAGRALIDEVIRLREQVARIPGLEQELESIKKRFNDFKAKAAGSVERVTAEQVLKEYGWEKEYTAFKLGQVLSKWFRKNSKFNIRKIPVVGQAYNEMNEYERAGVEQWYRELCGKAPWELEQEEDNGD